MRAVLAGPVEAVLARRDLAVGAGTSGPARARGAGVLLRLVRGAV